MLGLVSSNGAGITTLMRMIATPLEPPEGTIPWSGQDLCTYGQALRQVPGYQPRESGISREFSRRQFLRSSFRHEGAARAHRAPERRGGAGDGADDSGS
jgi:ABC-2 type transport system ATP-binding protein